VTLCAATGVGSVLGLALFAPSSVPSVQLFEAAGLLDVPLLL
jgi:hypothetical protein